MTNKFEEEPFEMPAELTAKEEVEECEKKQREKESFSEEFPELNGKVFMRDNGFSLPIKHFSDYNKRRKNSFIYTKDIQKHCISKSKVCEAIEKCSLCNAGEGTYTTVMKEQLLKKLSLEVKP